MRWLSCNGLHEVAVGRFRSRPGGSQTSGARREAPVHAEGRNDRDNILKVELGRSERMALESRMTRAQCSTPTGTEDFSTALARRSARSTADCARTEGVRMRVREGCILEGNQLTGPSLCFILSCGAKSCDMECCQRSSPLPKQRAVVAVPPVPPEAPQGTRTQGDVAASHPPIPIWQRGAESLK